MSKKEDTQDLKEEVEVIASNEVTENSDEELVINTEITEDDIQQNEREYLLERAKVLGLNVPKNMSTAKLRKAVADKISNLDSLKTVSKEKRLSDYDIRMDQLQLVRFRIHVLNPVKQNWSGELITVGNDIIPPITRFIPFNAVDGIWHAEKIIVQYLKSRKYQFMMEEGANAGYKRNTVDVSKNKLLPEFAIEILDPLTLDEIEQLKLRQAATGAIDVDNN